PAVEERRPLVGVDEVAADRARDALVEEIDRSLHSDILHGWDYGAAWISAGRRSKGSSSTTITRSSATRDGRRRRTDRMGSSRSSGSLCGRRRPLPASK